MSGPRGKILAEAGEQLHDERCPGEPGVACGGGLLDGGADVGGFGKAESSEGTGEIDRIDQRLRGMSAFGGR
ncbi:MAG: hypothetical protein BGN89_07205 [Alphaproteobacteria bacterium 64-6]|nr:MAG: hypothetical protein BGN89_07205 [Alphaproteobacteria bacterium 64-6]